tara:strand:+ start:220 stop:609 length:390 start_codon:yes stop_codon:yes gene_type:complete
MLSIFKTLPAVEIKSDHMVTHSPWARGSLPRKLAILALIVLSPFKFAAFYLVIVAVLVDVLMANAETFYTVIFTGVTVLMARICITLDKKYEANEKHLIEEAEKVAMEFLDQQSEARIRLVSERAHNNQ